ncbi:YibE/F family protein, partial [Streptomyces carpinensis]
MGAADRQSAGEWNGGGNQPQPRGGPTSEYGHDYAYGHPPDSAPHPGYGPGADAGRMPSPAIGHGHTPAMGNGRATVTGTGQGHGPGEGADGHGHAHSHSHGPAAPVSRHLRRVIAAILIPFAAAVVVGLAVLWPGGA